MLDYHLSNARCSRNRWTSIVHPDVCGTVDRLLRSTYVPKVTGDEEQYSAKPMCMSPNDIMRRTLVRDRPSMFQLARYDSDGRHWRT